MKEEITAASALRDAALMALGTPAADVVAAATTAPSAMAAVAAAISEYKAEYKAKIYGLVAGADIPSFNEAYMEYKKTVAEGVAHVGELEFFMTHLLAKAEAQVDVQSTRNQAPLGCPASPASADTAAAQVPVSVGTPMAVAGAAPRDSGDGQLGQRPSIKASSIEASKAKIEGHRAAVQQRSAVRGDNLATRRAEDL